MLGFWRNSSLKALSNKGVLGMNKRNISYISQYNPRHLFPLVDDKLRTKILALEQGLKTPELLGVIDSQHALRNLESLLKTGQGFCLKPAKGAGGKGILALTCDKTGQYYRSNSEPISLADIKRHCSNILAGLFSLGGKMDVVIIEGLLKTDPVFDQYSYEGVPDIRIIVFRGIPIMAMIRLSCAASFGKANLHQGAIGVGLNMANGTAVNAVQNNKQITHHPDTNANLLDIKIPNWQVLLELACRCYDISGLGYLGVDLVLDKDQGVTLLELNARPGLSIQIANNTGLLPRLKVVEILAHPELMPIKNRLVVAQNFVNYI